MDTSNSDNATDEVKNRAWELVCDLCPFSNGYRYNLKYELAEHFIAKAAGDGIDAGISKNLFVYDCPSSIPPDIVSDGGIYSCTTDDEEEAAAVIPYFYREIDEEEPPYEHCLEKVRLLIAEKGFFFWKNKNGKTVASCSCKLDDRFASISGVHTFPDERRKLCSKSGISGNTKSVRDGIYSYAIY